MPTLLELMAEGSAAEVVNGNEDEARKRNSGSEDCNCERVIGDGDSLVEREERERRQGAGEREREQRSVDEPRCKDPQEAKNPS